jgi:hypothetical protein
MSLSKFKLKLSDSKPDLPSTNSSNNNNHNNKAPVDPEDIDEVDDQGQSILMGIIAQLRPGCDLSRITLPTFILERKSMLERITNQLQQPNLLLEAHDAKDEVDRFLKVVKYYLSGWHIAPKAVKKPLNPVLGEFFTSYWDLPNGQQGYYIAEQTSHHPPKSSYFYMIPESHIRIDGAVIPKSRFLGNSTAAIMNGTTVLQFLDILDSNGNPEKYTFTQPNMYARGLFVGKMRIELGDHMIIKCPTNGLSIDIEFKTKGFISGTYDAIEGVVKDDKTGKELYQLTGKWNEVIYIKDLTKGSSSTKQPFIDVTKTTPLPPKVRDLDTQDPYESRNLWKHVLTALGQRNHEVATSEKFKIEDEQRVLRHKRAEDGVDFHPRLFKENDDPNLSELEYVLYKTIPNDADPETQTKLILESVPIVPGQEFTPEFDIPAFKKLSVGQD